MCAARLTIAEPAVAQRTLDGANSVICSCFSQLSDGGCGRAKSSFEHFVRRCWAAPRGGRSRRIAASPSKEDQTDQRVWQEKQDPSTRYEMDDRILQMRGPLFDPLALVIFGHTIAKRDKLRLSSTQGPAR